MPEEGDAGMTNTNPAMPRLRPPPVRRRRTRMPSGFSSIRDLLSFLAGMGLITNEVFFQESVEVAILTVGVALAGLPVAFGADEKRGKPATDDAPGGQAT